MKRLARAFPVAMAIVVLGVSSAGQTAPRQTADAVLAGDLNADGCVDRTDLSYLTAVLQKPGAGAHTELDVNHDGRVDVVDGRVLVTLFTNPRGTPCTYGYDTITRANVDSYGFQFPSATPALRPSISWDGRFVVFCADSQVWLRDRDARTMVPISVDRGGAPGNGDSCNPSVSRDGRFVVFSSDASNLVDGDTNGAADIFIRDRLTGVSTRVSVDAAGHEANGDSFYAAISADGRLVAFQSSASNLVPNDTNGVDDVFVYDRLATTVTRVSVDSAGAEGNGGSGMAWLGRGISADGRFVVFSSTATNLVAGDTNGAQDVFVHDRQTGSTTRVSVDSAGNEGNRRSLDADISADGRFVVFTSFAFNLVAGDLNSTWDVFVHDVSTGETTRVSVDAAGGEPTASSTAPSISGDGRFVAFSSDAPNVVPMDGNDATDIFVYDRTRRQTTRVNVSNFGIEAEKESTSGLDSYWPRISGDGRFVVFASVAGNLVPNDVRTALDIFVADRQPSSVPNLTVGHYAVAGVGPIDQLLSDYSYRASFTNASSSFLGVVTATLASAPPHGTIVDGQVTFYNVAAGATVSSADTFTIRQDNRYPIDLAALDWEVQTYPPLSIVSGAGGTVTLSGVATVSFPAGAFYVGTEVRLTTDGTTATRADFDDLASIFRPSAKLGYTLRINTGPVPPKAETIPVILDIPVSLRSSVPAGHGIALFAKLIQKGDHDEVLDSYAVFLSIVNASQTQVLADLPTATFANTRRADRTYEAMVTLASTPGAATIGSAVTGVTVGRTADAAEGVPADIACPLPFGDCADTSSGFSLARWNPIYNRIEPHQAIDVRGRIGDPVMAASDGIIERAYFSSTYGYTIILRHLDGAATLYAHLDRIYASERTAVRRGEVMAALGTTGKSTGPHLHFELVPNGEIVKSKDRVDPLLYVRKLVGITITAGGTQPCTWEQCLIALEVFLDGQSLGETPMGDPDGSGSVIFPVSILAETSHVVVVSVTRYEAPVGGSMEVRVSDNAVLSTTLGSCPTDTLCYGSVWYEGDYLAFSLWTR